MSDSSSSLDPATWERLVTAQVSAMKAQYPSLAQPGPVGDRFESAIHLVRDGAVSMDTDGVIHVASRTKPGHAYIMDGDGCPCEDARYAAPNGRCAHRIAAGLYRTVFKTLETQREGTLDGQPDDWNAEDARQKDGQLILEEGGLASPPPPLREEPDPVWPGTPTLPGVPNTRPAGETPGMQTSASIHALAAALAAAQARMANPAQDMLNPHFKARYASLAAVRDAVVPLLASHGIAVTQCLSMPSPGMLACVTTLWHTSGQWLSTTLTLPVPQQTPQGFGSAGTYARRYALMAVCMVAGDDDDGRGAETTASDTRRKG